jgi:hypothetical protein
MCRRTVGEAEGTLKDSDDSGEYDNIPIETELLGGGPDDDLDEWV